MHPSMFLADNSLLVRIFTVRIGTQRYTSNFNEDVYTKCVHVNNYFFIHKEGHILLQLTASNLHTIALLNCYLHISIN